LFRPEELELLVCGSQDLDFEALEKVVVYDSGYTKETPVIQWFWQVVHSFSENEKKRLLFFTTGTDRVPIGGLSKLNFVIARNGPDSDRYKALRFFYVDYLRLIHASTFCYFVNIIRKKSYVRGCLPQSKMPKDLDSFKINV
jgi:hypothetical protein